MLNEVMLMKVLTSSEFIKVVTICGGALATVGTLKVLDKVKHVKYKYETVITLIQKLITLGCSAAFISFIGIELFTLLEGVMTTFHLY